MRFTGRSETEREEQPTTAEPWLMLYRCVCLRQTGFFFLGSSFLWREEKRDSHRLEHLFTYPQSVAFSICLHRVIVACQIVSLSRKTRTTTPLVFRFPSLLLVSSVFGDGDDRPGVSRIFVTFLPPSLSCVCVCAYIFFWSGPTHRDWPWWIILRQ